MRIVMKRNIVILTWVSLFLASCEDVVDVKLKDGERYLVIDAFLNNRPIPQNIRISYSSPYFSNAETPFEPNANVKVIDLTTQDTAQFVHKGNGNYEYIPDTSKMFFQVNHEYQLWVEVNGNRYEAKSRLNRTTVIDTFVYEKNESNFGPKGKYFAGFIARDSLGGPDYYWFKAYYNGQFLSRPNDINLAVDGASGEGADGFFFTPNIAFGINPTDGLSVGDSIAVEIYSLNKETWIFLRQARDEMTNGGLFARTPENIVTNIRSNNNQKVLGFFNTGASSIRGVTIRE
ncbi:MAG: hypothetical protein KatS3mg035_0448 [Bacteroidia bacterium]|nr:MAG: hypothetical protein KatS3mg035_0448 [Bacteroidia bacterium]